MWKLTLINTKKHVVINKHDPRKNKIEFKERQQLIEKCRKEMHNSISTTADLFNDVVECFSQPYTEQKSAFRIDNRITVNLNLTPEQKSFLKRYKASTGVSTTEMFKLLLEKCKPVSKTRGAACMLLVKELMQNKGDKDNA